jgi:hypothetical protein
MIVINIGETLNIASKIIREPIRALINDPAEKFVDISGGFDSKEAEKS